MAKNTPTPPSHMVRESCAVCKSHMVAQGKLYVKCHAKKARVRYGSPHHKQLLSHAHLQCDAHHTHFDTRPQGITMPSTPTTKKVEQATKESVVPMTRTCEKAIYPTRGESFSSMSESNVWTLMCS